jgi:hypothetical protein
MLAQRTVAENISMVYVVSYICYNVFEGYNPLAAVMRSVMTWDFIMYPNNQQTM